MHVIVTITNKRRTRKEPRQKVCMFRFHVRQIVAIICHEARATQRLITAFVVSVSETKPPHGGGAAPPSLHFMLALVLSFL